MYRRKGNDLKLINQKLLAKLQKKNKGNLKLQKAVDALTGDIKKARWKSKNEVLAARSDADCVHNDGFYFFDIDVHRTMILIEYQPSEVEMDEFENEKENGIANILWVGTHDDYERIFKNNKKTIEKWLRDHGLIE